MVPFKNSLIEHLFNTCKNNIDKKYIRDYGNNLIPIV